jgi:hypothetical protein
MALRCKPGDLALIIRDEPGCEVNIGRLVRVEGSLRQCRLGAYHWLIKPVSPAPYAVLNPSRVALQDPQHFTDVEHPDLWLLPLRDEFASRRQVDEGNRVSSSTSCREAHA